MAISKKLSKRADIRLKREKHIVWRMWFNVLLAHYFQDRGKLLRNIGDKIYIGNNQFVTKYGFTAMICIEEFSLDTPVGFMSVITNRVKSKMGGIKIDFTLKNMRYKPNLNETGYKSRERTWKATSENDDAPEGHRSMAQRLLYSYDRIKAGDIVYRTRFYILVRATSGTDLNEALRLLERELDSYDIQYKRIKHDIDLHMKYATLISNKVNERIKDIAFNTLSIRNIAQLLPMTQGINEQSGVHLGLNRLNRQPYIIDFRKISKGRNIYVGGNTGYGKTFLIIMWLYEFLLNNYNLCIMDIKGNEFPAIIKVCGGYIVSLRPESTYFINTFKLYKKGVLNPRLYFSERLRLSKEWMVKLVGLKGEKRQRVEILIDRFLIDYYNGLGIIYDNKNTWDRSLNIHPYDVYDAFYKYASPFIREEFSDVIDDVINRLRMFMYRNGSDSHMFRDELILDDILEAKAISFDFGILDSIGVIDEAVFDVKLFFMNIVKDSYTRHKFKKGEYTACVLEESQYCNDTILEMYRKDIQLRRAQLQVTMLLGNSLVGLVNNPIGKALIGNFQMIVAGEMTKTEREYLIKEFGLEEYADILEDMVTSPHYDRTFLLVNRMVKNSAPGLIRSYVPESVTKGKMFHE